VRCQVRFAAARVGQLLQVHAGACRLPFLQCLGRTNAGRSCRSGAVRRPIDRLFGQRPVPLRAVDGEEQERPNSRDNRCDCDGIERDALP
jgi:hypothetical protein